MVDSPDLINCARAIYPMLRENAGKRGPEVARTSIVRQQRRDTKKTYRAAVEELQKVTGSPRPVAENCLQLIQIGAMALRWEDADRHIGDLGELVSVVIAHDPEDRRYTTLKDLSAARHAFSQSLRRLGRVATEQPDANADTKESAKAARGRERDFVIAWNEGGRAGP